MNKKGNALINVLALCIVIGLIITSFVLVTSPKFKIQDEITMDGTVIGGEINGDEVIEEIPVKILVYDGLGKPINVFEIIGPNGPIKGIDGIYKLSLYQTYTVKSNRYSPATIGPITKENQDNGIVVYLASNVGFKLNVKDEYGKTINDFTVIGPDGVVNPDVSTLYTLKVNETYQVSAPGMNPVSTGVIKASQTEINLVLYYKTLQVKFNPLYNNNPISTSALKSMKVYLVKDSINTLVQPKSNDYYVVDVNDDYLISISGYADFNLKITSETKSLDIIDLNLTKTKDVNITFILENAAKVNDVQTVKYRMQGSTGNWIELTQAKNEETTQKVKLRLGKTYEFTSTNKNTILYTVQQTNQPVSLKFINETKDYTVISNSNPIIASYKDEQGNNHIIQKNDNGKFTLEVGKFYTFTEPFGLHKDNIEATKDNDEIRLVFKEQILRQYRINSNCDSITVTYNGQNGEVIIEPTNGNLYMLQRYERFYVTNIYGSEQRFTAFKDDPVNITFNDISKYRIISNITPIKVIYTDRNKNQHIINPDSQGLYDLRENTSYTIINPYGDQKEVKTARYASQNIQQINVNFTGLQEYTINSNILPITVFYNNKGEINQINPTRDNIYLLLDDTPYTIKNPYDESKDVISSVKNGVREINVLYNTDSLGYYKINVTNIANEVIQDFEISINNQIISPDKNDFYALMPGNEYKLVCKIAGRANYNKYFDAKFIPTSSNYEIDIQLEEIPYLIVPYDSQGNIINKSISKGKYEIIEGQVDINKKNLNSYIDIIDDKGIINQEILSLNGLTFAENSLSYLKNEFNKVAGLDQINNLNDIIYQTDNGKNKTNIIEVQYTSNVVLFIRFDYKTIYKITLDVTDNGNNDIINGLNYTITFYRENKPISLTDAPSGVQTTFERDLIQYYVDTINNNIYNNNIK